MDRYIIKNLLREGLLDEDYATHNELKDLTDELYLQICQSIVRKAYYDKTPEVELPQLYYVFNYVKKNYVVLKDFIDNFKIKLDAVYEYNALGSFVRAGNESGIIVLRLDEETIESSLENNVIPHIDTELTRELQAVMVSRVYTSTYDSKVISTLLHELQHAYDSWRSSDKYKSDKRSREYYDKLRNDPSRTQEKYEQYLKLQHEINARFSEAIGSVRFFDRNFGKDKSLPMGHKSMRDFNAILSDFKREFRGFDIMPPTVQKRLLNRLGKMYQEASESLNNQ